MPVFPSNQQVRNAVSVPIYRRRARRVARQFPVRHGAFVNEPLESGDSMTLRVNTESGATSIIRVQVPQSLSGEESVEL